MRTEKEMFDLILGVANRDNRIRAVYMNGSRTNPNVKKDIFQDYDIVYVVTETESFINDEGWISVFGEPIIFQEPDKLDKIQGRHVDFKNGYTYLMQFTDGNRIDLHIQTMEELMKEYGNDKLTFPLLDKDNCLSQISPPSDQDYWVEKPTYGQYFSRCNNFWWVAPYCAKGLWREEILFTIEVMNSYVRQELLSMLSWYVGTQTEFKVSMGKANKYLKEYLDSNVWTRFMKTFNMGDYDSSWNALITTCELFQESAPKVGKILGYEYNYDEAKRSFEFIKYIKDLPKDAMAIY
ncbi:aminoglycoside 6-adenylyltransferase [Clostridium frigidicarnis]|uniref:Aminoglycoside 6-adenylyltransferase n=1 Tax=Clostridium frigidicarnis TaxID=84698 RepID=A0A1I0XPI4_9CLOT|nr:aminoglycoside 6-adenylyltransferase [Clostridium frigidicarnis]SFB03039.1 aminoglycoside 6-adenylyltransferase [Clostridium frigidicarnis]